jgi:hypothetical protein
MKNFFAIFYSLFILSCSNESPKSKIIERHVDSILEENEIDDKFEKFEGGSHQSEQAIHKKLIDFSIEMLYNK